MSLIFVAGQELLPNHLNALANCKSAAQTGGSATTTSSSFANTPATSSVIFTKVDATSRLRVDFHAGCYVNGASVPDVVEFAVQINGTDYAIVKNTIAVAFSIKQFSGIQLIGGITAGPYTIQARWRRVSGTGTVTIDGNCTVSFAVKEVQE